MCDRVYKRGLRATVTLQSTAKPAMLEGTVLPHDLHSGLGRPQSPEEITAKIATVACGFAVIQAVA